MSYQPAPSTSSVRSMMQRRPADPGKIEKARNPRQALNGLLRYLGPFKVGMTLVFVFVVIYTFLGLIGPYLMGQAIDRFITTKQVAGLAAICLWMLVVYLKRSMA